MEANSQRRLDVRFLVNQLSARTTAKLADADAREASGPPLIQYLENLATSRIAIEIDQLPVTMIIQMPPDPLARSLSHRHPRAAELCRLDAA
jgi:hypothetical protein